MNYSCTNNRFFVSTHCQYCHFLSLFLAKILNFLAKCMKNFQKLELFLLEKTYRIKKSDNIKRLSLYLTILKYSDIYND